MLIAGAKGHAKEVLDVFRKNQIMEKLFFFDDVSTDLPDKLYGQFPVLKVSEDAKTYFSENDTAFVLGVGGPLIRQKIAQKLELLGGVLVSVISDNSLIGDFNVKLGTGLNIMHHVFISNDVKIGNGTLINAKSNIHHDVVIGEYCELSPCVVITGGVRIGNNVTIGTGATILPKITIGDNAIIGAGAVVTKDIPANCIAVGIPAKRIK